MRQAREKKNGSGKMHFEREIRWKRRGHYLNIYIKISESDHDRILKIWRSAAIHEPALRKLPCGDPDGKGCSGCIEKRGAYPYRREAALNRGVSAGP